MANIGGLAGPRRDAVCGDEDTDASGAPRMSRRVLASLCRAHGLAATPSCNSVLYLQGRGFRRIENLEAFVSLRVLHLEHNSLTSLEGIQGCTALQSLHLQCNCLSQLSPLSRLPRLAALDVSANPLGRLVGLPPGLRNLRAANTGLSSPRSLSALPSECPLLELLDVSDNGALGEREGAAGEGEGVEEGRGGRQDGGEAREQRLEDKVPSPGTGTQTEQPAQEQPAQEQGAAAAFSDPEPADRGCHAVESPGSAGSPGGGVEDTLGPGGCPGGVLAALGRLRELRVLYCGGTALQQLPHYRRRLVVGLPRLTYLDAAPVEEAERRGALAWSTGGLAAERAARAAYRAERQRAARRAQQCFAAERAARRAAREAGQNPALLAGGGGVGGGEGEGPGGAQSQPPAALLPAASSSPARAPRGATLSPADLELLQLAVFAGGEGAEGTREGCAEAERQPVHVADSICEELVADGHGGTRTVDALEAGAAAADPPPADPLPPQPASSPPPPRLPPLRWPAECCVCSEGFRGGERLAVLACAHAFHQGCIRRWLLGFSATCPTCRAPALQPGGSTGAARQRSDAAQPSPPSVSPPSPPPASLPAEQPAARPDGGGAPRSPGSAPAGAQVLGDTQSCQRVSPPAAAPPDGYPCVAAAPDDKRGDTSPTAAAAEDALGQGERDAAAEEAREEAEAGGVASPPGRGSSPGPAPAGAQGPGDTRQHVSVSPPPAAQPGGGPRVPADPAGKQGDTRPAAAATADAAKQGRSKAAEEGAMAGAEACRAERLLHGSDMGPAEGPDGSESTSGMGVHAALSTKLQPRSLASGGRSGGPSDARPAPSQQQGSSSGSAGASPCAAGAANSARGGRDAGSPTGNDSGGVGHALQSPSPLPPPSPSPPPALPLPPGEPAEYEEGCWELPGGARVAVLPYL